MPASDAPLLNNATSRRLATGWGLLRQDWPWDLLCLLVAIIIAASTNKLTPRRALITKATLYEVAFPVHTNTVPSWTVPFIGILGPIAVMLVVQLAQRRAWREFYRLVLALLIAVLVTGAVTNCIKLPIGRPRPNFLRQCWPDGVVVWQTEDEWVGDAACSGSEPDELEARKSFPSGHSSWSASGLGFLTLYCLGQLRAYSGAGHTWRLVVASLPALVAVAIGVTRVVDSWHHPTDVLTGLALGFSIAWAVYRQQFPPLIDEACAIPMFMQPKQT